MNSMPDMPIQVPVDDANADTEWNDILRKHGIIPERPPSPTKEIEESIIEAAEQVFANRYELMDKEQLDELEDDLDPEFWAAWRHQKINEMVATTSGHHGSVYPLQKSEYQREVTEASEKESVLVLLTGANRESTFMSSLWAKVAGRWVDVKFCQIRATLALEQKPGKPPYPDALCPTFVSYVYGETKTDVGLATVGGFKATVKSVEEWMVRVGAVDPLDKRLHNKDFEDESDQEVDNAVHSDSDLSDWD